MEENKKTKGLSPLEMPFTLEEVKGELENFVGHIKKRVPIQKINKNRVILIEDHLINSKHAKFITYKKSDDKYLISLWIQPDKIEILKEHYQVFLRKREGEVEKK